MTKDKIIKRFFDALEALADEAKLEVVQQGHRASGKGVNSIGPEITSDNLTQLVGAIYAADYLVGPVDKGVKPGRVPFGGGRSSGRTSRYIQGLMNWAKIVKPGMTEKERKGFVFAVAKTQKKEGIPTRGSYSFSRNGRRKGWIENGIGKNAEKVEENLRLFELVADSFEESIRLATAA